MSQKSILIKTAINIAIVSSFPEAAVLQETSGAMLDLLTDCYEDRQEKKNSEIANKLRKLYEKSFSEEFLRENGINYKKAEYYKSQIFDILNYTKISVSLLAECNNSTTALCNYMISAYRDKCLNGVLEDETDMRKIFCSDYFKDGRNNLFRSPISLRGSISVISTCV